jgi:hypothetical protein
MPTEGSGRHLPPSTARLAAAARAGMFPRSPLGFGGEAFYAALAGLIRDGLEKAAFERPDPVVALLGAIRNGAIIAAPLILAPAAATLVAAIAPALWARRHGRGSTTAQLPEAPPRTKERAILFCAAAVTAAFAVAWGFAGIDAAARRIVAPIADGIFAAGVALLLAGLADLALQRVRLVEALSLTRSEASREDGANASARRSRSEQRAEVRRRGAP